MDVPNTNTFSKDKMAGHLEVPLYTSSINNIPVVFSNGFNSSTISSDIQKSTSVTQGTGPCSNRYLIKEEETS